MVLVVLSKHTIGITRATMQYLIRLKPGKEKIAEALVDFLGHQFNIVALDARAGVLVIEPHIRLVEAEATNLHLKKPLVQGGKAEFDYTHRPKFLNADSPSFFSPAEKALIVCNLVERLQVRVPALYVVSSLEQCSLLINKEQAYHLLVVHHVGFMYVTFRQCSPGG